MRKRPPPWRLFRRLTASAFLVLLVAGSIGGPPLLRGSLTASRLGGRLLLADPLASLEVLLARHSVPIGLAAGALLLVLVWVILGRVFCGWVCPLGLLLDLADGGRSRLRRLAQRGGLRLPDWRPDRRLKYGVLLAALTMSAAGGVPAFQVLSPINFLVWGVLFTPGVGLVVVLLLVVAEFFSRRLWCRAICPLGALHCLIGRAGRLRVRVDPATAGQVACGLCSRSCPMGIPVMEDHALAGRDSVADPECTRCGDCAESCLGGVLALGFRKPGSRENPEALRPEPPSLAGATSRD